MWDRFKDGDRQAFETIYREYVQVLFDYGIKILRDKELILDCIQELFTDLWHSRARLSHTTSVKYYLFRALRRRIVREAGRRHERLDDQQAFPVEYQTPSEEVKWIDAEQAKELKKKLERAFGKLTKRQKEALFLLYYNSFSYKETASIMQLRLRTVYNTVHLAIEILRKHMRALPAVSLLVKVLLSGIILLAHFFFFIHVLG